VKDSWAWEIKEAREPKQFHYSFVVEDGRGERKGGRCLREKNKKNGCVSVPTDGGSGQRRGWLLFGRIGDRHGIKCVIEGEKGTSKSSHEEGCESGLRQYFWNVLWVIEGVVVVLGVLSFFCKGS